MYNCINQHFPLSSPDLLVSTWEVSDYLTDTDRQTSADVCVLAAGSPRPPTNTIFSVD